MMAKKGTLTREHIVEKAAGLFNCMGYFRSSMSDLMAATGLEKGGIYNHFQSKDELAVAAFEYAVKLSGSTVRQKVDAQTDPMDRLLGFIDGFRELVHNPPIAGGCPILNCAVENDEGNALLKETVLKAMERLLGYVEGLVSAAQASEYLPKSQDARKLATFIVSSLEGGIMLGRLYRDTNHMDSVAENLKVYLRGMNGTTG